MNIVKKKKKERKKKKKESLASAINENYQVKAHRKFPKSSKSAVPGRI